MNVSNIHRSGAWFEVLQTDELCQTAVMTLAPGRATGADAEAHESGEQVLFLVSGELIADIAGELCILKPGDIAMIPPNVKHKFTNTGTSSAVTFNVYSPPVYPRDEKG